MVPFLLRFVVSLFWSHIFLPSSAINLHVSHLAVTSSPSIVYLTVVTIYVSLRFFPFPQTDGWVFVVQTYGIIPLLWFRLEGLSFLTLLFAFMCLGFSVITVC